MLDVVIPVYNEEAELADRCIACTAICATSSRSRAHHDRRQRQRRRHARIAASLADELDGVRVVRLEEKGRGRALRAVWSTSDAPVLAYMDVDLSTDLAALAPLVAPLISGHSDLAIGTRLGRGHVVRGPKREIISRCYVLILKSTLAARSPMRSVDSRRSAPTSRNACFRTSPTPAGSSTPNCWCWPNAPACASTKCRWTGWTTRTPESTSWRPLPPTSRASRGCCAASHRAPYRANGCGTAGFVTARRRARLFAAPVGALREHRNRIDGCLPAAVHDAARVDRCPGREPDRAARHRDRQHRSQSPIHIRSGRTRSRRAPPRRGTDRLRHRARHHQRGTGHPARRRARTRYVDAIVLVAANLLATAADSSCCAAGCSTRAETDDSPETRRKPNDDAHS